MSVTHRAVTIHVDVTDRDALRIAAERRAWAEGIEPARWRAIRAEHGDETSADLVMLFDPGLSPDGCKIIETNAA